MGNSENYKFKPIELKDKPLFDMYFSDFKPSLSEFTFTNLFCWRLAKCHEYCIIDSHILVSSFSEHKQRKFYQPIGKSPAAIIKKVLNSFPNSVFERADKEIAGQLSGEFKITPIREHFDYIYRIKDLIGLEGADFAPKRNFIRRFISEHNPRLAPLDEKTIPMCLELEKKWCNIRNCGEDLSASSEDIAVRESLWNFEKLNLLGVCVIVRDIIEAFAIGEPLNDEAFVEHFEKANPNITGIYPYLLSEFAKEIPDNFRELCKSKFLTHCE